MFQFKNGRLYPDITPRPLSFKLPEGFWFDTYADGASEDSITLRTVDKKATVDFSMSWSSGMDTEEEAKDEFEGTPADEMDGPYPITVGEFQGSCIYCLTELPQYVIFLDVSSYGFHSSSRSRRFYDRVTITVSLDKSPKGLVAKEKLDAVIQNPDVRELIESLKVE